MEFPRQTLQDSDQYSVEIFGEFFTRNNQHLEMAESSESQQPVESITLVISADDVFGEASSRPRRKPGRKRKSESRSSSSMPQKPDKKKKVYEMDQPFEDLEQERKRINAINAKKHRDLKKKELESLRKDVTDAREERDRLKTERESLRERINQKSKKLEALKEYLNKQANSIAVLLENGNLTFE